MNRYWKHFGLNFHNRDQHNRLIQAHEKKWVVIARRKKTTFVDRWTTKLNLLITPIETNHLRRKKGRGTHFHFITLFRLCIETQWSNTQSCSFRIGCWIWWTRQWCQILIEMNHLWRKKSLFRLCIQTQWSDVSWVINGWWHRFRFSDRLSSKVRFYLSQPTQQ